MLTLNHVVEQQAATLAACPRPRALARAARGVVTLPSVASRPAAAVPSAVAPRAGFGAMSVLRPWADERPVFGYGSRRDLAGLGFATVATAGAGSLGGDIERERTISTKQDEQAQNYLTHRREPRSWRPPH